MEATTKIPLAGLLPDEIAATCGLRPFQGRQVFRWLHDKRVFDFDRMSDLSKPLRATLAARCAAVQLELAEMLVSPVSGTKKALLRLPDGETVESVLIRDGERVTICLSSQVGCPLKCAFCATGLAGFTRNLTAAEIVEQALFLLSGEELGGRTPNIVYMGMGEPFRNYDEVLRSARLLMETQGLNIGARKITLSTAGEVGGIARLAQEDTQIRLSVSLHAANDKRRSELVPLNRRFPLDRLREAIMEYQTRSGRQVTFEWTLLDGVNDQPEDVDELVDYAGGLRAFVNLIPWNPVPGLKYAPSPPSTARAFRDALVARGIKATLRQEKGQDIDAACGQLRRTWAIT
jgi:23S rRNA (adenine2503-C2)-methyltransferase